jgi:hypothetical protein
MDRMGEQRIDQSVVEAHRRAREHLGLDEGFRVEDLTTTQFLQLQVDGAQRRVDEAMRELALAQGRYARAKDELAQAEKIRNRHANEGEE